MDNNISPTRIGRKRRFCITPLTSNHESPPALVPLEKRLHHRRSRDRLIKFAIAAASSVEPTDSETEKNSEAKRGSRAYTGTSGDIETQCMKYPEGLINEYFLLLFEWICEGSEPNDGGSRKSYRISLKQSYFHCCLVGLSIHRFVMSIREGFRKVLAKWRNMARWSSVSVPPLIAFSDNVASVQVVSGHSMSPTLNGKQGSCFFLDVVLVSKTSEFRKGDIVLLMDPLREKVTKLVKRVAEVSRDGSSVYVLGDNVDHSTDSRHFGSVPSVMVEGVVKAILFPPWRWTSF